MSCVLIIPSYKPPESLIELFDLITMKTSINILIVNDGSPATYQDIFDQLEKKGATVTHLTKNMGKGAAIRLGLEQALKKFSEASHFAFCDDDGQHSAADVIKIIHEASSKNLDFVLGSRTFGRMTPWKSLLGNNFMSFFLKIRHQIFIRDSQSGLRCFTKRTAALILEVKGERFGYELQTLITLHRKKIKPYLVPIETIYHNANRGTRFRAIADSARLIWLAMFPK